MDKFIFFDFCKKLFNKILIYIIHPMRCIAHIYTPLALGLLEYVCAVL